MQASIVVSVCGIGVDTGFLRVVMFGAVGKANADVAVK
jgi:hypothetical protein